MNKIQILFNAGYDVANDECKPNKADLLPRATSMHSNVVIPHKE